MRARKTTLRFTVAGVLAGLAVAALLAGCVDGSAQTGARSPSAGGLPATVSASTSERFYSVDFVSAEVGWAAGAGGVFATRDGGATWKLVHPSRPAATTGEVDLLDAKTGFALLPDGLIKTTDAGNHWSSPVTPEPQLSHVDFTTPTKGWAIGRKHGNGANTLFRTDDGGRTYEEVLTPAESVCFGSQSVGWVASRARVLRTTDGGANWTPSFVNPFSSGGTSWLSPALYCAGQDVAWLVLAGGDNAGMQTYAAYRTTDGGGHWRPMLQSLMQGPNLGVQQAFGERAGPLSVLDAMDAYVVTTCPICHSNGSSAIQVTHDGGKTWTGIDDIAAAGSEATSVDFVDREHGWLATANGIFATSDGGTTWRQQLPPGPRPDPGMQIYRNARYKIQLEFPAGWVPDPLYGSEGGMWLSYRAPDGRSAGFVQIGAAGAPSLDYLVDVTIHHQLRPFGDDPIVRDVRLPAGDAKLILPDPSATYATDALLIIAYPKTIVVKGSDPGGFLELHARPQEIEQIGRTLQFLP